MVTRRIVLGVVALSAVLLAGCTSSDGSKDAGGSGSLPDGATVLRESAEATKGIKSVHFVLDVDGTVPAIPVQAAEGDLTREGEGGAKGTVKLTLMGQLIDGEFVLTADSLYIKGPTGKFQKYPAALSNSIYDPSAILDPERGVANVLAKVQNPVTEAREDVDGAAAYRVKGRAGKDVVASVVPGVNTDVDLVVWVRVDDKRPAKAAVTLPGADGKNATVNLTLSDVDKPVTVSAPTS